MLVWWVVLRDFAREGPWGEGSTRAWRVVRGFERTECACRGPMSPPPIMAILKGGVVVIFLLYLGRCSAGFEAEKLRWKLQWEVWV